MRAGKRGRKTVYLFDASAIANLVKKGCLRPLAEGATPDLAIYEALNVVWKEHYLLRRLDEETAKKPLSVMGRISDVIAIASIRSREEEVFELAVKEGLTIYDAAYLHYALRNKPVLVTDDIKLREKAKQYLETMSTRELMQKEAFHASPGNIGASTCGFEKAMGYADSVEGRFESGWERGVSKKYF